jgi:hypothetical protein
MLEENRWQHAPPLFDVEGTDNVITKQAGIQYASQKKTLALPKVPPPSFI